MKQTFTTITLSKELYQLLKDVRQPGQSLAGIIELLLIEYTEKHQPLIDKISQLQSQLDYFERQNITPELLDRLKYRQHPYQTIGGVIEELIALAQKVDKMGAIYPDKALGRDM